VDATRTLNPEALARTLAVVRDYAATCARLGVEAVRVAGTSAARDARNAEEFSGGVEAVLGVRPEVLTGQEEAATSFLGATYDLPGPPRSTLVFDIGGGSTELMVGRSGVAGVAWAHSLDIGSVRLTERHVRSDPLAPAEVAAVRADAEAELATLVPEVRAQVAAAGEPLAPLVVGVAGTVTTVTAVSLDLAAYDPAKVHRATLGAGTVAATAERLCALTVAEKAALPVMPPGREDVIAAGALILDAICRVLQLDRIMVSETDILDGLLLGLAARLTPA
jgi:exopolyphosphatase / guanosine-5'-triphosphate,3'-diphosphate pyrophosphatase